MKEIEKDDKKIRAIAFTDRGMELASRLMEEAGGESCRSGRPEGFKDWTARNFHEADTLVFVGAAGIAVRAISPHVTDKTEDPAVIVIDESGKYVIPILSGHLGGANDMALYLAGICGGEAVLTTATDLRGLFAVDQWAKRQRCRIIEPEKIKDVSGGILAGKTIKVRSDWSISGSVPEGCALTDDTEADVALSLSPKGEKPIHLVPRICVLGVGCRKGTKAQDLEDFFQKITAESELDPAAIHMAASIDIKAEEEGLIRFCESHGWELVTYTSEELRSVQGDFSGSAFVEGITGVDNVCERSAVKASGGSIICAKKAGGGITMAVAAEEYRPDWRWLDE